MTRDELVAAAIARLPKRLRDRRDEASAAAMAVLDPYLERDKQQDSGVRFQEKFFDLLSGEPHAVEQVQVQPYKTAPYNFQPTSVLWLEREIARRMKP